MPFQHSGSMTQKLFEPSESEQSVNPRGAGTCCWFVVFGGVGLGVRVAVGVGVGVELAVTDGVVGDEVA